MDTISSLLKPDGSESASGSTMRQRRSYSKVFKVQVVQQCLQPRVPVSSAAMQHGINANVVRKWLLRYRDRVLGKSHARFLGGWTQATVPDYPTTRSGPRRLDAPELAICRFTA